MIWMFHLSSDLLMIFIRPESFLCESKILLLYFNKRWKNVIRILQEYENYTCKICVILSFVLKLNNIWAILLQIKWKVFVVYYTGVHNLCSILWVIICISLVYHTNNRYFGNKWETDVVAGFFVTMLFNPMPKRNERSLGKWARGYTDVEIFRQLQESNITCSTLVRVYRNT